MNLRFLYSVVFLSSAVAAPLLCAAAGGVRVNLGVSTDTQRRSMPTQQCASMGGETVHALGRGIGVDEKSALDDAFSDAIKFVIGFYIDAEMIADNDKIVKDRILTHSNAYVTHYEERSRRSIGGSLTEIQILATIQKRPLTQKLQEVMPPQTVTLDGRSLKDAFAVMTTTEKRANDAAALLENALSGFNPVKTLLVAKVRPETQKILSGEDLKVERRYKSREKPLPADKVILRYICELRLDRQKYFAEFLPNLERVVEQISVTPPKEVRISALDSMSRSQDYSSLLADYKAGTHVSHRLHGINGQTQIGGRSDYTWLLDEIHVYGSSWNGEGRTWPFGPHFLVQFDRYHGAEMSLNAASFGNMGSQNRRSRPVEVAMITELNDDATIGKAIVCNLDAATEKVWHEWMKHVVETDDSGWHANGVARYSIILQDNGGHELAVVPWQVRTSNLMCVKFADMIPRRMKSKQKTEDYSHVFVTPFVGCFGDSYIEWKDLAVSKDLLRKIDSIQIELAQ